MQSMISKFSDTELQPQYEFEKQSLLGVENRDLEVSLLSVFDSRHSVPFFVTRDTWFTCSAMNYLGEKPVVVVFYKVVES